MGALVPLMVEGEPGVVILVEEVIDRVGRALIEAKERGR